jgi:DegV family protein with EDD domain
MANHRPVRVVTDSTSDMPESLRSAYGIAIAPLLVSFGSTSYQDGIDLSGVEFFRRLGSEAELPKTSQPPMSTFEAIFKEAIANDHDVVCVTIASQLSGTFNSARLAAEAVDSERIRVVDSGTTTMGLGWVAVAAARAARAGANLEEAAAVATEAVSQVNVLALLQTLDYVYKGGRIGRATHLVGSALAIKPIVGFDHGVVTPLERVRTWKKALSRIVDMVDDVPTDIWVGHAENQPDASRLQEELHRRFPNANIVTGYCGSTIGVYSGPGAIAIATFDAGSSLAGI